MRVLVIEPKPAVAKKIAEILEGHKLVDATDHSLSQGEAEKLEENVVVATGKVCDDVDDAFTLVFCKRADEDIAAVCGVAVVLGMTEKS